MNQTSDDKSISESGASITREEPLPLHSAGATPGFMEFLRRWPVSGRATVAIRGGAWTLTGYAATQLLRTSATIILARYLLGPETFGIVGLVGVFLGGLSMFSELGILANVVQHARGDDLPS